MGVGHLVVWGILFIFGTAVFAGWIACLVAGLIGARRKNLGMIVLGVAALFLPLMICGLAWMWRSPAQTFNREFGSYPPSGIRNLKIETSSLSEYPVVFMRFETSPEIVASLLNSNFKRITNSHGLGAISTDELHSFFGIPSNVEIPDWWQPVMAENSIIYQRREYGGDDVYTLITQPSTDTIFYVGEHF